MVWLPIVGFDNYEVSDTGEVRTTRARNGRGVCSPRPVIPRKVTGKLYLRVTLTNQQGKQVDRKIHLLVLEAFSGLRPSLFHDGCHRDGNAANNHSNNLYWGSKQDNANDRVRHGTQIKGEAQNLAKLTEAQVSEIRNALPTWKRGMGNMFAKSFGVGNSTISAVKHKLTWKHI